MQLLQRPRHRHLGVEPAIELARHPQRYRFRVGLGLGQIAVLGKVGEQLTEVLDDAVMDHRHLVGGVRMGIAFGGRAMRRPAGMTDTDIAAERLEAQLGGEIAELAFGAAAADLPTLQRRDAGAVIAAIFQPLERIDQSRCNRLSPDNPDNTAHLVGSPTCQIWRV